MKALLTLLALASLTMAEVPKGVDKKWDRTLTVTLVTSGSKGSESKIRFTAIAPDGGDLTVKLDGRKWVVPAGETLTEVVIATKKYTVVAYYNGRVLDTESWNRKTGLGVSKLDTGKGL